MAEDQGKKNNCPDYTFPEQTIFRQVKNFPFFGYLHKLFPEINFFVTKKRRPLMIICETVNICNNDCIICAHSKMTRKKETMSLELFEKVVQDYCEMGGGKLSLTPMIGDIFLDKYLIDRLKILKKYPKITGLSVTTNAVLSDRYNDLELKFILSSFERFHISIYGLDGEEYQTMTQKSHYTRMLLNVAKIVELADNKNNIVFGFRFLKSHTDDEIRIWIHEHFKYDIQFFHTRTYSNWGNQIDTSKKLPFDGEWIPLSENTTQCLVPIFACQIFSNGDVSFCACPDFDINNELKLGNIRHEHLIDLYNSDKCERLFNFYRYMPDFCKRCTFFRPISDLPNYAITFDNPINFIGG